eukprot:1154016-Pelagomonas_calceolata.AAC.3
MFALLYVNCLHSFSVVIFHNLGLLGRLSVNFASFWIPQRLERYSWSWLVEHSVLRGCRRDLQLLEGGKVVSRLSRLEMAVWRGLNIPDEAKLLLQVTPLVADSPWIVVVVVGGNNFCAADFECYLEE